MPESQWMRDLFSVQSGTIIGEINDYFLNKRFTEPQEILAPSDEIIGQMTDYEKAMYSILSRLNDQLYNQDPSADEAEILLSNIQVIDPLFWGSIHLRYKLRIGLYTRLTVRQGFVIVVTDEIQRDVLFMLDDEDDPTIKTVGSLTSETMLGNKSSSGTH